MSAEILEISRRLQADLRENDHYTVDPMFCMQVMVRDSGYNSGYSDNKCWWNAEQCAWIYDDDSDETKRDLEFDPDSDCWDGPFGYQDRWETVMVALTRQGLEDYMKRDGHNVRYLAFRGKTRIFVESFRRCDEMVAIREYLLSLSEKGCEP